MNLIRSARESVTIARTAEAAGIWGLGTGDTVPKLYQDTYVTASTCLAATEQLHVGPTVTNTVTRHWSVLGATARTFEKLYPGRFFAGLATGDGSCHSVGLKPATWAQLEADVANVRTYAPDLPVQIAASGPRGAEAAGRVASDFIIGTGLDVEALRTLAKRARDARAAAGITDPLRIWAFVTTYVSPDQETADAARISQRGRSSGTARFSFSSTFEDKAVPEHWQPILRERLARYDFNYHGVAGADNPNGHLFDDHPELQDYITDRFQLMGTADQVEERMHGIAEAAGLDGVWCSLSAMSADEDVVARVRTTGEALRSLSSLSSSPA